MTFIDKMDKLMRYVASGLDPERTAEAVKLATMVVLDYNKEVERRKEVETSFGNLMGIYNCLCDRLDLEEGWDPREEDE